MYETENQMASQLPKLTGSTENSDTKVLTQQMAPIFFSWGYPAEEGIVWGSLFFSEAPLSVIQLGFSTNLGAEDLAKALLSLSEKKLIQYDKSNNVYLCEKQSLNQLKKQVLRDQLQRVRRVRETISQLGGQTHRDKGVCTENLRSFGNFTNEIEKTLKLAALFDIVGSPSKKN